MLAVVLPDVPADGELPRELLEHWKPAWEELLTQVRNERPEEGSDEERALLLRSAELALEFQKTLGTAWADRLRDQVDQTMRTLVEQEKAAAHTEKQLALRWLSQAVTTFGTYIEYVQTLQSAITASDREKLLEKLEAVLPGGEVPLTEDVRLILRWELDLTTALFSLTAPHEELAYWARRASRGARQVEALLNQSPGLGVRREIAEWRARHAWEQWDDEELEHELEP